MKKRWLTFLLAGVLFAFLSSCGGGGNGDGGDTGAPKSGTGKGSSVPSNVQSAQKGAQEAREKALNAGAKKLASQKWEAGEDALSQARASLKQKEYGKARVELTSARSRYQEARRKAETEKNVLDRYTGLKKDVAELENKAKKAEVSKFPEAKNLFSEAMKNKNEAIEALSSSKNTAVSKMRNAKLYLTDAVKEAELAAQELQKKLQKKKYAQEEKDLALEKKKAAEEVGAEKEEAYQFSTANDYLREGDRAFENERYQEAQSYYRDAKSVFVSIIDILQRRKEAEKETTASAGPEVSGPSDTSLEKPPPDIKPPEPPEDIQEPQGPAAGGYAALIRANLDKLFAAPATYENGKVHLDYSDGTLLKKDVQPLSRGNYKLLFKKKRMGEEVPLSFDAGGRGGKFCLKPRFQREVTVKWNLSMDIIDAQNAYILLHALTALTGQHKGTGFASSMGVRAVLIRNLAPAKAAKTSHKKAATGLPPHRWYDKTNPDIEWKVELNWPKDSKTGSLRVSFDGQEVSRIPEISKMKYGAEQKPDFPKGRVVVAWNNCMFHVKNFTVEGVLEPRWAINKLKNQGVTVPDAVLIEKGLKEPPEEAAGEEESSSGESAEESKSETGSAPIDF